MNIADLLKNKPILFDGATGTEYQKRGLKIGEPPEKMTLNHPDIVEQLHREYIHAGSRVIETNTFGGNRLRLRSAGLEKSIIDFNKRATEIALRSAMGKAVVAGSVGPLGVLLEPYGDTHRSEAGDAYTEQIALLLQGGVEFILFETMISLEEASLALTSAREAGAGIVGVTLTFDMTPEGPCTPFGESPAQCIKMLAAKGAAIIGSNCGNGFEVMKSVAKELRTASKSPILIQPNAGLPVSSGGDMVYPESPAAFARFVKELSVLGVECLGGCCGTPPPSLPQPLKSCPRFDGCWPSS